MVASKVLERRGGEWGKSRGWQEMIRTFDVRR
jgi:hypothetical protein